MGACPGIVDIERELGRLLGDEAVAHDTAIIAGAADGSLSLSLTDTREWGPSARRADGGAGRGARLVT